MKKNIKGKGKHSSKLKTKTNAVTPARNLKSRRKRRIRRGLDKSKYIEYVLDGSCLKCGSILALVSRNEDNSRNCECPKCRHRVSLDPEKY